LILTALAPTGSGVASIPLQTHYLDLGGYTHYNVQTVIFQTLVI